MDLRTLVDRIPSVTSENTLFTFEKGRAVHRTFAQAYNDIITAQALFTEWGVRPGMRVGILSPNSYDWMIYDLALISLRAVVVAFTDDFVTYDPERLCSRYDLALLLTVPSEKWRENGHNFVVNLGSKSKEVHVRQRATAVRDPEYDTPGLIFSSGSSGGVKGMFVNRRGVEDCIDAFTSAVNPKRDDRLLLFLPMSNYQQRLMYYAAFWYGFNIIITNPTHLFRALQEFKPTIMIAPPSLYEAFETRFLNLSKSRRFAALILGRAVQMLPICTLRRKLGRLIFRQVHDALGGKMRLMVTGMAPIKHRTLELFSLMQLPLFETYGLIESGSVSLNLPEASRIGSVGRPLCGVTIEFRTDGEIVVRRKHQIAAGYFECAEGENEKTFIGPGTVATGDIGYMDRDGFLYLTGRKKEIIVTGGGEKIHPEVVEAVLNSCPEIERAVVFGRPNYPSLVAIIKPKDGTDALTRMRIEQYVERANDEGLKINVSKVVITDQTFSRENGFLRPNLKLDRKQIGQYFKDEIEDSQFSLVNKERSSDG